MEHLENSTAFPNRISLHTESSTSSLTDKGDGDAFLYILIVMCFYGVFLCGVMLVYFRSKRREKRRINIFTRLVHEEERREWGALPKKNSLSFPAAAPAASGLRSVHVSLPFCGFHGSHFGHRSSEDALPSPLACALCTEQSSISSLCSSADTHIAIEEESDSGTAEEPEEQVKGGSGNSGDDSG
ncbi:potassium voltage-gated channel subfamily E member 4 [Solea senegalensis]|uniref:Potassium voltage-gated channel subfamily E member 4 n=1 Tax=Solea senegalensis TaxID=28829 RepID=A0AAV6PYR6_SOLSE|nr:potassium voltage-gated channel subfamily E member 4 [Solea senegalensis]KAG7480178.1 potassium voltage-gated channel subfamily E member 4 [Solea senegalensis]